MSSRERALEKVLRGLLKILDHAATCPRCIVDLDEASDKNLSEERLRQLRREGKALLAPERRPN